MAKPQISYITLVTLLLCFLLFASIEMQMAEAKLCSKRSQTWTSKCIRTRNCNRQCITWEGAKHGACHRSGFGFACFCYYMNKFRCHLFSYGTVSLFPIN